MKLTRNKHVLLAATLISVCVLIMSRFVLLYTSARFIWDESDDLVRMSQMYHRNPITLIGPMNANKTFFQSSLTYYMVMPGAALTNFHPMGPVYATAVYGCLTVLLLAYILMRFYRWKYFIGVLFLTCLFPLVQTSRWAWNPHFIPFWQSLGILIFLIADNKKMKFWAWGIVGFLLTLTLHNHWYAFFSAVGFGFAMLIYLLKQKRIKEFIWYVVGSISAIAPLLIFDILHPPGLFITRALIFSPLAPHNGAFNLASIPLKLVQFPIELIMYFVHNKVAAILIVVAIFVYGILVLRDKTISLFKKILLIPIAFQIIGLTLISGSVFDYYYLGAVIPLIIFLSIPDKAKILNMLRIGILTMIVFLGISASIGEIKKDTWMTNIHRKMQVYQIIKNNLPKDKKCNVFVPASKSGDAVGKVYRDLLIARDDVWLFSQEEYNTYECIFIVSTASIGKIKKDPAYELDRIRDVMPLKSWRVGETDWKVYYFETKKIEK